MDQEAIDQVVQTFYRRVIGAGETDEAASLIPSEIHVTSFGGRIEVLGAELTAPEIARTHSLDDLLEAVASFHQAFSRVRIEIESAESEGSDLRVYSSLELTPEASANRPNPPVIVFHNRDLVRIDDDRRIASISRDIPGVEVQARGATAETVASFTPRELVRLVSEVPRLVSLGIGSLPGVL